MFVYLPDLPDILASADLVISHGGAGTLLPLLPHRRRIRTIAVPNPTLLDHHQRDLVDKLAGEGLLEAATLDTLVEIVRAGCTPPGRARWRTGRPREAARAVHAVWEGEGSVARGWTDHVWLVMVVAALVVVVVAALVVVVMVAVATVGASWRWR